MILSNLFKNPTGSRLLCVQDKDSPSFEITLFFKIGSRYDFKTKQGLAHLVEHMNFQGTEKYPTNTSIVLAIENMGAQIDAFTSYEYMGFSIKCPPEYAKQSIQILFDLILNSQYQESQIAKEKAIILEEIKMYEDMPAEMAQDLFQENLFKGNNLGCNIAGKKDTLLNITKNDIYSFNKGILTQDNALVVVTGNFNERAILDDINQYLNKLVPQSAFKCEHFKQLVFKNRKFFKRKDIKQTNVVMGGYSYKREDKPNFALKIGNIVLSGGMGSVLYQKIREEMGLVYYINSTVNEFNDTGFFSIEFGADNNKFDSAIMQIKKLLTSFKAKQLPAGAFERAKNYYKGLVITQIETASDLALWNANKMLFSVNSEFYSKQRILEEVDKVTLENIFDNWGELLTEENLIIAAVGPKEVNL